MSERSPEGVLWDFLRGAMMTRALAIVADLGVADALADEPRSVRGLAQELGAEPDMLRRLLRALASDGIFEEVEPGVFRNTATSELLRDPSQRAFAHLFGGVWHRAVGELEARSAAATFPRIHETNFWAWLAGYPEERAAFDTAMVDGWESRVERLGRVSWRGNETIVDVGGGNGSLLIAFLRDRPGMRGVVFDLPETMRDETGFGERIVFVSGSFFERVPEGDVHVLSTILHDWDDEHAAAILRTIRAAARPDGRLVIIDGVIPPGNDPDGTKWADLLMLAVLGGRERDDVQWRTLLEAGGFEPVSITDGLVEARCR